MSQYSGLVRLHRQCLPQPHGGGFCPRVRLRRSASRRARVLAPALAVAPLTHQVMLEKNIDFGRCYPKEFETCRGAFDLIVNMSGYELPRASGGAVEVGTFPIQSANPRSVPPACATRSSSAWCELIETLRSRKPAVFGGAACDGATSREQG